MGEDETVPHVCRSFQRLLTPFTAFTAPPITEIGEATGSVKEAVPDAELRPPADPVCIARFLRKCAPPFPANPS
jgi:hypothetical protein